VSDVQSQIVELQREVDRQSRLIDELYRQLGLAKVDVAVAPGSGPDQRIVDAIRAGNKILAIKIHREINGTGLKQSKDAVEVLARALGY
jgi:ribosomal protein L7/L12